MNELKILKSGICLSRNCKKRREEGEICHIMLFYSTKRIDLSSGLEHINVFLNINIKRLF